MGQIVRSAKGPVKVPARLLDELDWLLDMDLAAPRGVVKPLADKLRDYHRDLDQDSAINHIDGIHDWLTVLEVDAMQRLRGWHRLRYGTLTVEARWLAEVRNILDAFLLDGFGMGCEEYANQTEDDPAEHAIACDALDQGAMCYRCEQCRYLVMRDRIDVLLDVQGFDGGPYYKRPTYDPEALWRERVMANANTVLAVPNRMGEEG